MSDAAFVGLIADTHGLMRPEALAALAGCELIVHAGDVGSAEILRQLSRLAPVVAVRGNNDRDAWARDLPETRVVAWRGRRIFLLHDAHLLALDPAAEEFDAVVSGHSHRPSVERRGGVLFVNPGSAGPRRFRLPVAIGHLTLGPPGLEARILALQP